MALQAPRHAAATVLALRPVRDQHGRALRGLLGRVVRVRDDPERGSADRGTGETGSLGDGPRNLRKGRLDIGNSRAPVKAEFPDLGEEELSKYTGHVVGVDAQPIVVSEAIAEAGVDMISTETLKGIYAGEITD